MDSTGAVVRIGSDPLIGTARVVIGQIKILRGMDVAERNGVEIMSVTPIKTGDMDSMAVLDVTTA